MMGTGGKEGKGLRVITPDGEIDFREVWSILLKRKMIILGVLFATLMITTMYIHFTKPKYESRAVIRIGQVTDNSQVKLIESPASLTYRLREPYKVTSVINDKRLPQEIITVAVQGYTPSETQDLLINMINKLVQEHQVLFDDLTNLQRQHIQFLQKQIEEASRNVNEFDEQIKNLKHTDTTLAAFLSQEKSKLLAIIPPLENELVQSKIQASKIFTFTTETIQKPTKPVHPIFPKKNVLFFLAVFIGAVLGIIIAFVLEYKENFEKSRSKPVA